MEDNQMNNLTQEDIAKKGGKAKFAKYGKKAYSEMGKKSAETNKARYGEEYFKELARKGLEARRKKKLEQQQAEKTEEPEKLSIKDTITNFLTGKPSTRSN